MLCFKRYHRTIKPFLKPLISHRIQRYSSDEKINHPWLSPTKSQNVLHDHQRIISFIVGNLTCGNLDALARDWKSLPPKYYTQAIEAMLQTHVFVGFPRMINALTTCQSITDPQIWKGIHEEYKKLEEQDKSLYYEYEDSQEEWREKGKKFMEFRWGEKHTQMTQERMRSTHPMIQRWIQEYAWGRVLSRPGLDQKMRSLCILICLAGLNVPRQLTNQFKGSLNVGCTKEEIECILEKVGKIYGNEIQTQVDELWRKFLEEM